MYYKNMDYLSKFITDLNKRFAEHTKVWNERDKLHRALETYGEHLASCTLEPCNCGLAKALKG